MIFIEKVNNAPPPHVRVFWGPPPPPPFLTVGLLSDRHVEKVSFSAPWESPAPPGFSLVTSTFYNSIKIYINYKLHICFFFLQHHEYIKLADKLANKIDGGPGPGSSV